MCVDIGFTMTYFCMALNTLKTFSAVCVICLNRPNTKNNISEDSFSEIPGIVKIISIINGFVCVYFSKNNFNISHSTVLTDATTSVQIHRFYRNLFIESQIKFPRLKI